MQLISVIFKDCLLNFMKQSNFISHLSIKLLTSFVAVKFSNNPIFILIVFYLSFN